MSRQLAIHGGAPVAAAGESMAFEWPVITDEVVAVVVEQLRRSISIYDNGGIFGEFEREFASIHQRRHALLFNSGTSALLSIYEGAGLDANSAVLCPVYTFHATVSPMVYLGIEPIFCDTDGAGNLALESMKERRTSRCSAVMLTHMWGVPAADTDEIARYCAKEGLLLFEDCSHAHGAKVDGKYAGSYGTAAAWSLQGQKIVSGGEGGILLTDDDAILERSLLLGHYNKRPLKQLDEQSALRAFFLTGMGLKLRAHPLAIAIALQQLRLLPTFLAQKRQYAAEFSNAIAEYDFLTPVAIHPGSEPSWYAFNIEFDADRAGTTRERFAEALVAEGLVEVDIPGSTGLLNDLPLFTRPEDILGRVPRPWLASERANSSFPCALRFWQRIVKVPVWAFPTDRPIVDRYIEGIRKVADHIAAGGVL